ncbi:MAG: hypothetical protein JSS57_05415 [Proteobacteria bacterium]|nr:hypothetical protein [Pseudomonadota bacterium]
MFADRAQPSTATPLPHDDPVSAYRSALQWSLMTLDAVEEALHFPVASLAAELACDGDYAHTVIESYKMLRIERAVARARERCAAQVLDHLHAALWQSGRLPSDDALHLPLDLTHLPALYRSGAPFDEVWVNVIRLLR